MIYGFPNHSVFLGKTIKSKYHQVPLLIVLRLQTGYRDEDVAHYFPPIRPGS